MSTIVMFTLGFKDVFWDSGGVWLLMLAMALVWIINTLSGILNTSEKMKK